MQSHTHRWSALPAAGCHRTRHQTRLVSLRRERPEFSSWQAFHPKRTRSRSSRSVPVSLSRARRWVTVPAPPGALAQPRGRKPRPPLPRIPSVPSLQPHLSALLQAHLSRSPAPLGASGIIPDSTGRAPRPAPGSPPPRGISPPPPAGVQVKTRESRFLLASPSPPSPGDGFSSPSHASLARPLRPAPLRNGPRAPAAATRTLRLRLLTPSLPSVPTTVPAPAGVSRQFRQRLPHSRCAYGAPPPVLVSSHSGPPPPRSAAVSELGRSANPTESLRPACSVPES